MISAILLYIIMHLLEDSPIKNDLEGGPGMTESGSFVKKLFKKLQAIHAASTTPMSCKVVIVVAIVGSSRVSCSGDPRTEDGRMYVRWFLQQCAA